MSAPELAEALGAYFTEGRVIAVATPSDPSGFRDRLAFVVSLAGGNRPAGRLLGLSESSIRRWLAGAKPRRQIELTGPIRTLYWVRRSRFVEAYNGYTSMVVVCGTLYSGDHRDERRLHVGREIPRQRIQAILRAWEAGNDTVVGNNLMRAIKENYFHLGSDRASLSMVDIFNVREIYFEDAAR